MNSLEDIAENRPNELILFFRPDTTKEIAFASIDELLREHFSEQAFRDYYKRMDGFGIEAIEARESFPTMDYNLYGYYTISKRQKARIQIGYIRSRYFNYGALNFAIVSFYMYNRHPDSGKLITNFMRQSAFNYTVAHSIFEKIRQNTPQPEASPPITQN